MLTWETAAFSRSTNWHTHHSVSDS
uniref:Uncharacterized protein n=1 Tax=Anguilla anguilla TaxID=7936 RepID=A0A0E9W3V6_ANGAN